MAEREGMPATPATDVVVRIHLLLGTADGPRVIDNQVSSLIAVECSRTHYPSVRERPEFERAGVYILLFDIGAGFSSPQRIYIGEAGTLRERLDQQARKKTDKKKEWDWNWLVAFTGRDFSLNKAHVKFVEAKLIEIAKKIGRSVLVNDATSKPSNLSEMDRVVASKFLNDILLEAPILGIYSFEDLRKIPPGSVLLHLSGRDASGDGFEVENGFLVRAGAHSPKEPAPSAADWVRHTRETLLKEGVLATAPDGDYVLTKDWVFSSPSTAAAAILARHANGRTEWKDEKGRTLAEIQEEALGESVSESEEDAAD
jgi:hypothetical protein